MRAFIQLFLSNLCEWRRDPSALMWTVIFPVTISLFIGVEFFSETLTFEIGIVNEDGDGGQMFIEAFAAHDALTVKTGTRTHELDALKKGKRRAVIIIPEGASETAQAGVHVPLEVRYDPGHQNAPLILSAIQETLSGLNITLTGSVPPLTMQPESLSATEFRRIDYMLPGVLAMGLMQLGLFTTAPLLVSLRERQVLRRLRVTPLRPVTMLIAQISFRLVTALLQTVIVIIVSVIALGIHVEVAHIPAIIGMGLLGAAVFIALSYFLAAFARTEEAIQGLIGLPNVLFMMLSGIFFPVSDMPGWIRPVVDAIPLTYLGDGLRQLVTGAPPLHSLRTDVLVLVTWLVACSLLAVRFFRWEPQA